MQKLLASCITFLCMYRAASNPPPAGHLQVAYGSYRLPEGYRCGSSAKTHVRYPKDLTKGPFPIASYGHGSGGGTLGDLSNSIASLGFVVVAPATWPCSGDGNMWDILYAIEWSQKYANSHPALAHVDWSRAAIFGYSFGGHRALWAAGKEAEYPGRWNITAVVASHGFSGPPLVPTMFMSGGSDGRAQRDASWSFSKSGAAYKVWAAVEGGRHMEPYRPGRLNPFAAHFLGCHTAGLQRSCDMVYGNGPDTICRANKMSNCEVVHAFTGTSFTGTTTTVTTTTTPCHDCITLRDADGTGCLKSNGGGKLLEKGGSGDCVRFRGEGNLFRAVDVQGQCLDLFSPRRFGLWTCHGKHNQQWHRQGSTWCVESSCVEVNELTITTTMTTTHTITTTITITSSPVSGSTTTTTSLLMINTTTTTSLVVASTNTTITTTKTASSTSPTATTSITTTSSDMGRSIQSGQTIFLRTLAGDGNHVDVEGVSVRARWFSRGKWQALTIEKKRGGNVHSGDVVYLRSHTGTYLDVVDGVVQSRWQDKGDWQAMTIEKRIGGGAISSDDVVCFRAHGGKHLDVDDDIVRARFDDCGNWQAMKIEVEPIEAVFSGESIHLLAHTGNRIDVEGTSVRAMWSEAGLWQTFTIESYGGRAIFSGDTVFLKAHTGKLLHVQNSAVRAEWDDYGSWQAFIIQKVNGNGPVMPGNSILLSAHTGAFIDVEGTDVQARWRDAGLWQSLVIEKSTHRRLTEVPQASTSQIMLV